MSPDQTTQASLALLNPPSPPSSSKLGTPFSHLKSLLQSTPHHTMPTTVRLVRVDQDHRPDRAHLTLQKLSELLCKEGLLLRNIFPVADGYRVHCADIKDIDKLLAMSQELERSARLKVQLPPDLRARMTLVVRRVPFDLLAPGVARAAFDKAYPKLRVSDFWIGQKQKMMKVTLSSPVEAAKLKDEGIRMSMYSLPDIEFDLFVDIGECLWCYRLQSHSTSKCPHKGTEYCSICGLEGHRYTVCPRDGSQQDSCLNCTRLKRPAGHRTRSGNCPFRKEVVNCLRDRARAKDTAATVLAPPFSGASNPTGRSYREVVAPNSSTRREAAVPAHAPRSDDQLLVFEAMWVGTLADAGTPGSFGRALEATLRKNGLPAIKVPDGLVDGGKILERLGVGIPVPERPGVPTPPSDMAGGFPPPAKPAPAKQKAAKPDAGGKATAAKPGTAKPLAPKPPALKPQAQAAKTSVKPKVPASGVKPTAHERKDSDPAESNPAVEPRDFASAHERKDSDPAESNPAVEPRDFASAEMDPSITTIPSSESPAPETPLVPPPKRKRRKNKHKQPETAQAQTETPTPPPSTPEDINVPALAPTSPTQLPLPSSLPQDLQHSPPSPRETTDRHHYTDTPTFSHSDTDTDTRYPFTIALTLSDTETHTDTHTYPLPTTPTHSHSDTDTTSSRSPSCSSNASTCSSGSATLSSPSRKGSPSPARGKPSSHLSPPPRHSTPPPSLPSPVFPPTPLLISSALSPHTSTPILNSFQLLPSLTPISPIEPSSEDSVDLTVVSSNEAQADGANRFSPIATRLSRARSRTTPATPRRPSGTTGRSGSGRRRTPQPLSDNGSKE